MTSMSDSLTLRVLGKDVSGQKTLDQLGKKADVTNKGIAAGFKKTTAGIASGFGKLGGVVGGELGDLLDHVSGTLDAVGEHGHKLTATGAGLAGLGAVLTGIGSAEKQAGDQLAQAIANTGGSISDYKDEIEHAVKSQENFGHSATDTKAALTTLTQSTQDPKKALEQMGVVADLAASKHISLADSAQLVAKILAGSGSRTLKSYGITTKDTNLAIQQLSQRLHGQASAAVDNWSGRLKVAETKVGDFVGELGQKFGPAITTVGTLMIGAGAASELWAKRKATAAAKAIVADSAAVAANTELAASEEEVALAGGKSRMAGAAGAAGLLGVAVAAGFAGNAIAGMIEKGKAGVYEIKNLGNSVTDLKTAIVNATGPTDELKQKWLEGQLQASGLAGKAASVGITVEQMTRAIQGGEASTGALVKQWKATGKPSQDTIFALLSLSDGYNTTTTEADKLAAASGHTADSTAKVAAAAKQTVTAVDALSTSLDTLSGKNVDAEQAQLNFDDALGTATKDLKDNGHAVDDNTAKGRANKEWLLSQITAINGVANAQVKAGASVSTVTSTLGQNETALRNAATAAHLNTAQVDALIKRYAATPKTVYTQVIAKVAPAYTALQELYDLERKLGTVTINAKIAALNDVHHNAQGTGYFGGGLTTIDEIGNEVVQLPQGSKVYNGVMAASKFGHGGNTTELHFHLPPALTGSEDLKRQIKAILEEHANTGGTLHIGRAVR